MIERSVSAEIFELAKQFPLIGIIGPRQCGKTTLVKQLAPRLDKDHIYLDLEKPSDIDKLTNAEFYFTHHKDSCIILDEIQRIPELFPLMRSIVDEDRKPLQFILLGSASPKLLRQSSESLAGRITYIELAPFNRLEIKNKISVSTHHFRGGFPLALLASGTKASQTWLDSFIRSYIERDLPSLGFPASSIVLRKLLEMLAWSNGNILNYSNLSKSLSVSNHTLRKYIEFLENAFLVKRLQPYFFNQKKRLVKSPKIYIRDTGLLHRLLRIDDYDQLLGHPVLGSSWESYVIEQINNLKDNHIDLYFYRTLAGAEVDLVLVKSLKPIATIEIKFSSQAAPQKGMLNCIDDLGTAKNFIITPSSDEYPVKENIQICNIDTFLEKYLPQL